MSTHAYAESERLRASFAGREQRMVNVELRAASVLGAGFLACAATLAALAPHPHGVKLAALVLYVIAVAIASEVHVEIGSGFTVPTQVAFVPMLFALPAPYTPLLVTLSLALAMTPSILTGRVPASRLITTPGNSWFALGPALVLTLAHDHQPGGRWLVLTLALLAQFACDFCSNAAWERLRGGVTIAEMASEMRQVYSIDLALAPLGLLVAIAAVDRQWALLLITPLLYVLRWFSKERRARMEQLIELNDAYRGTALLLGDVVEADDSYTGAHCKDVVRLALELSRELGLDLDQRRTVEFGALLHDIGKIAVPKEIVNKPGKLDPDEWEIIKTHTVEGQRMLERIGGFMGSVGQIVRGHHERWDGHGYPDGLRGEQIPLAARIISCCDAFNAMTTDRPYRRAMPSSAAVAELVKHAGTQFDPLVVDALSRVIARSRTPEANAQEKHEV